MTKGVHRLSPSRDPEAEFAARPDFPLLVDDFLQGIQRNPVAPNQNHFAETEDLTGLNQEGDEDETGVDLDSPPPNPLGTLEAQVTSRT